MDYKFFEKFFKNKPAKITAESDDKGIMDIMLDGRAIELLSLSLAISARVIEKCPLSVDEYCEILKKSVVFENNKSKEQNDVENVIIDKMLRDIFK